MELEFRVKFLEEELETATKRASSLQQLNESLMTAFETVKSGVYRQLQT